MNDLSAYLSFVRSICKGAAFDLARSGVGQPATTASTGAAEPPEFRPDAVVTAGASGGVFLAMLAAKNSGRRVVAYESPGYPIFSSVARAIGMAGIEVPHFAREGGAFAGFAKAIDAGAEVVCLQDPHNPTGYELRHRERSELIDYCSARGVALIVDRVFADFAEDSSAYSEQLTTTVARSFSKSLGLGADRLGWISPAADLVPAVVEAIDLLQGQPIDPGGPRWEALVGIATEDLARNVRLVSENSRVLRDWLGERSWATSSVEPRGLPFATIHISGLVDSRDFAFHLRERRGTAVIPGALFGLAPNSLRLGLGSRDFAVGLDQLGLELELSR